MFQSKKSSRSLRFFVFILCAVLTVHFPVGLGAEPILIQENGVLQPVTPLDSSQGNVPSSAAQSLPTDPYNGFLSSPPLTAPDADTNTLSNANAVSDASIVPPAEVTIDTSVVQGIYSDETDLTHVFSNDTYSSASIMWGFFRVNAEQAWSLTRGSGITIAVIDTGLDMGHEDIAGNVYSNLTELNGLPGVDDDGNGYIDDIRGWDFVNSDNNPTDDNGHGTHVSGVAAAAEDNGKGIAGVAPDAKILPVKVLDARGSGTIANVIKGIKYAADLGAQIINMSLGVVNLSGSLLKAFQDAVNYALGKGSIVVTAAGNSGKDTSTTAPANLNNTIAIGATDSGNLVPSWSNKNPDLVAPGVSIASLYPGNRYVYMQGTSMASPFAAGAAALIYAYYKNKYSGWDGASIYSDIYMRLTRSASDFGKAGYDSSYGYGLLDVFAALTYRFFTGTPVIRTVGSTDKIPGPSAALPFRIFSADSFAESMPNYFAYRALSWGWCRTSVSSDATESEEEKISKKKSRRGSF